MTANAARLVRVATALSGLVVLGWFLTGHAAQAGPEGLPTDWSHQHLIFSQPGTTRQAQRVTGELRYWQQWYRQKAAQVRAAADSTASPVDSPQNQADWSESLGSGASVGAGNFPAKYTFFTNQANCAGASSPDYVVFSTGLLGSSSQASVVAYDNLYSGCGGTTPQVYWAYNTGGQILTSPTISEDGTQVAYVQTNSSLEGTLVLLKWAASTTESVSSPMTLTAVSNAAYRACTAPCMTTIFLKTSSLVDVDDRTSSPFVDYTHDTLWVGGGVGWLHKITGVFRGTPGEVTIGGFPVQVNPGNPNTLSSPVHDFNSGNIFVGDYGGFFYRVNSTTGAVTASGQIDHGTGVVAGPIVDSTSELVYVFASSDGSTACSAGPCAAVYQFTATFGAGTKGNKVTVGNSAVSPNPMYEGTLDGAYQNSANATGSLFVCGNTGGAPTLYRITITAGVYKLVSAGPALSSVTTPCSPVSDIPNPNISTATSEWIFASAQASGTGNSCASGGCVMNFASKAWTASTAYSIGQEILDTRFNVQVVSGAGTSGASLPGFSTTPGVGTTDGTAHWVSQGVQTAAHAAWAPSTAYVVHQEILDSNGNIEVAINSGTSGSSPPTWKTLPAYTTIDGAVHWLMLGKLATASQAAASGTSGIIMDNVIPSTTLAGASQIYYSTLSNQTCGTSGTGGCAVQTSQSALQ